MCPHATLRVLEDWLHLYCKLKQTWKWILCFKLQLTATSELTTTNAGTRSKLNYVLFPGLSVSSFTQKVITHIFAGILGGDVWATGISCNYCSLCSSPVPCFEGIAGPLEQIALHSDSILGIHIVLQFGVVIRKILRVITRRTSYSKRWPTNTAQHSHYLI